MNYVACDNELTVLLMMFYQLLDLHTPSEVAPS